MAQPIWITPAGTLAEIDEGVSYTKQLVAIDEEDTNLTADANDVTADNSSGTVDGFLALTYSIIAGTLPSGLQLSSSGIISGVPNEVTQRTEKRFVVRVTDGVFSVDRTFKLFVQGSDAPIWITPAGSLGTVGDGQFFSFQLVATDPDNDIQSYTVQSGNLPDGVTLNTSTGLLSGVVDPIPLESFDSTEIGWDAVAFDNTQYFDQIIRLGTIDTNYEFVVAVSDGIFKVERAFSIFVTGTSQVKADTTETTSDITTLTADASDIRGIVFVQPAGLLATIKHQNYNIVKIDTIDPDEALGLAGVTTVTFTLESGTLPTGMELDSGTSDLFGVVPTFVASETTFTFTIRATKTVENYEDSIAEREYSVVVQGAGYGQITWDTTAEEIYI